MNKWYFSNNSNIRGVFLCLHGLGNSAYVMNSIISYLNEIGFHCYNLTLPGHNQDSNDKKFTYSLLNKNISPDITREGFLNTFTDAYLEIKEKFPDTNIYNVSFSLGGAITIDSMLNNTSIKFQKIFLFAPAIFVKSYINSLKAILFLRKFGLAIPNLIPKDISSARLTPIATHNALFKIINSIHSQVDLTNIAELDAIIFLSPNDALVSYKKITNWINSNSLSSFKVIKIKVPSSSHPSKHIFLSEKYAGNDNWVKIKDFFLNC